jgi:hypothetical protein
MADATGPGDLGEHLGDPGQHPVLADHGRHLPGGVDAVLGGDHGGARPEQWAEAGRDVG